MKANTIETIDITHAHIGQLIASLRVKHNISPRRLEKMAGYGGSTVSKLETAGKYKRKRGGHWRTICDLLDTMGYEILLRKRK